MPSNQRELKIKVRLKLKVTSENTVGPKEFYAEHKNGNVGYLECDSGDTMIRS